MQLKIKWQNKFLIQASSVKYTPITHPPRIGIRIRVQFIIGKMSRLVMNSVRVGIIFMVWNEWMNECLTTPQHKKQIGYWGEREMFYLTMHSTHFIYGYRASDIWLRTILIVRKETRCRHIGYSYRLTARVLLYAPSHRQDNIYHSLCYTSRGALAGTRNSSMGHPMKHRSDDPSHHEMVIHV